MEESDTTMTGPGPLRVLVAIAHHGHKNRPHLDRMLQTFRSMSYSVDVVVLSEAPKDLDPDVEIRVGAPSSNPWSLPFGHRRLFDERKDDYDLFVYAEDDTLIEERHLDTFLELTNLIPERYLLGSIRYELDGGERSYCSIHSHYRWEPASVIQMEGLTFARLTNDHAAWYALTRDQLARAITSGQFLVAPHDGRYDMLVSAATDVFTNCGFERVLCLERIDDLLVHHLPNVYLGRFGIDERSFRTQLGALFDIAEGRRPPLELIRPETHIDESWNRHLHTRAPQRLSELVPERHSRVLSVGAGSGDLEMALVEAGHVVATVATDAILAEAQRALGLEVLEPSPHVEQLLSRLPAFDHVLLLNLLPYVPDPPDLLRQLRPALRSGGWLTATVPDHRRYELRRVVMRRSRSRPIPRSYDVDGIHRTDTAVLRGWLRDAGYAIEQVRHRSSVPKDPFGSGGLRGRLGGNAISVIASTPVPRQAAETHAAI